MFDVGQTLDKYRLTKLLGEGGMGSVYAAENVVIGKKVAIKVLHPAYIGSQQTLQRFLLEAKTAATLEHPGVVEIFDYGTAEVVGGLEAPFIVMELLRGRSLSDVIKAQGPVVEVETSVEITLEILSVLMAVHNKGIIHRDLKPENVFQAIKRDGTSVIKILDFGISKVRTEKGGGLTDSGTVLGTPYYMSPEQANGRKDIDRRVDIFALGAMLYQMVTGRLPFPGESYNEILVKIALKELEMPRDVNPDLPEWLEGVILKAMAFDRDERYRSAGEFSGDLTELRNQKLNPQSKPSATDVFTTSGSAEFEQRSPASHVIERPPAPSSPEDQEPSKAIGNAKTEALKAPVDSLGGLVRDSSYSEQKRSPLLIIVVATVCVLLGLGAVLGWFLGDDGGGEEVGGAAVSPDDVAASGSPSPREPSTTSSSQQTPPVEPEPREETVVLEEVAALQTGKILQGEPLREQRPRTVESGPSRRSEDSRETKAQQKLLRSEVSKQLRGLTPKVRRCVSSVGPPPKIVTVKLRISGNGSTTYIGATPSPPGKVSSCLGKIIASARFRATGGEPFTVNFPFSMKTAVSQPRTNKQVESDERLLNNPFANK